MVSGFAGCPSCASIRLTLARAFNILAEKNPDFLAEENIEILVLNNIPEENSGSKDKYMKEFIDAGLKNVHILFPTNEAGEFSNEVAKAIEKNIMTNSGRGHSLKVKVFDKNAEQVGEDIFAAVTPGNKNARNVQANAILKNIYSIFGQEIK